MQSLQCIYWLSSPVRLLTIFLSVFMPPSLLVQQSEEVDIVRVHYHRISPSNTQSYLNITISQSNSIISSSSTVLPLGGGNIFHLRRDPGKGFHKYKSVPRIHSGRFSLLGGTIFSLNLRWGFLLDYTDSSHIQITITIPNTKGLTMGYVWSFKFIKNSIMEGAGIYGK